MRVMCWGYDTTLSVMGSLYLEQERSVILRNVCFVANVYAVKPQKPRLARKNCGVLKSSEISFADMWH